MASSSSRSVKVTDLNPHLLCVLCGGYYVDATTIIECLHSFCKSCIVRYLETNKYCPICDVQVHKSKPLLNIRSDRKLQAIVYKLVPGLFQRELNCRKEFYKRQLEAKSGSGDATAADDSPVFLPGETLLLGVKYADSPPHQVQNKRYLRCPAAITISHLQKLMRAKFDLSAAQKVEFLHEGDLLPDHIPLMDLAYMYHWKRKHPIELEYRLLECQQKKMKLSHEEDNPVCKEEKQDSVEHSKTDEVVSNSVKDQPDREVQLQISENGVMSVQSVDSSADNTVVTSQSDGGKTAEPAVPVKDIQLETMELVKSLGNDVTLSFDSSLAKTNVESEVESNNEIPTNNNTIKNERLSDEDHKSINCMKDVKEDVSKNEEVSLDVKSENADSKESTKKPISVNNNDLDRNKSLTINSSLSITVIPPASSISTPAHAQKVYPGAVKDGSNHLRHFKTKEVPSEIKKPEVTIKPTSDKHEPPKSTSTARYKTLKSPIKPWNPTIPRSTIMAMKQAQAASQEKDFPGKATPKVPKFFKMRNVPRFLGNPASGVKPMYQVLPGSELTTQAPQTSVSQSSKPVSVSTGELTVMKIDPKTLNPITVSHSRSSKLNSSSSKPSTTTHKPSERDLLNCGTPIRNPVSKSSMSSRAPSQVHSPSFPSNPFGLPSPHILYPGFPRPFSQVDASGNQLPADSQILRAMSMLCSPGAAFHPSLPPSISMLFNPHHPHHRSTTDKLNFKYNPSDFHKATNTTTPSVQRIPPSGPSSKISSSTANSLSSATTESFAPPSIIKELDKHLADEKSDYTAEEPRRSESFMPTNDTKPKSTTSSTNADRETMQSRIGKISPLPITNGLSIASKGNLDKDFLKLHNQNMSAKLSVKESADKSSKGENQRADSKNVSESNCC